MLTTTQGSADRRVVCLIDGDGAIFSPDLIAQGHDGGLLAAKMLAESVRQDFSSKYKLDQFHLYVYVFYNKRGLVDAIGRAGHWNAKQKFDEFSFGFNQAAERFIMVDVGSGKEQADAKIKGLFPSVYCVACIWLKQPPAVHLEDNIRLPQTSKILFAGKHTPDTSICARILLYLERLSR